MNPEVAGPEPAEAQETDWYEIRIQGRLGKRWVAWFDDMTLQTDAAGLTTLRGRVLDQAALHGVLARVRDIGLPLLAVERIEDPTQPRGRDERDPPRPAESLRSQPHAGKRRTADV